MDKPSSDDLFFQQNDLTPERAAALTAEALEGCDDGELFLEYDQLEALSFDDGKLKTASFNTTQGFGLRAICGEATGYAHASEISEAAILRAAGAVNAVRSGHTGTLATAPNRTNRQLYTHENLIGGIAFQEKIELLREIDAYARAQGSDVSQVSVSLAGNWQAVHIIRPDGATYSDFRPLVRLSVAIVAKDGARQESGSHSLGGRGAQHLYIGEDNWRNAVQVALAQARTNLQADDAPAGEMDVVLGPGWPGILLHEAVGHGLEGDFNRKKTSAFAGLVGERVAAPGVTVVDDGTLDNRRGSLSLDDEGTPTHNTTLIEDGILVGFMQDRLNARLMGVEPTGNGRRQSFAHQPMPRMTNTYMLGGDKTQEEIIASVKNGLFAVSFGGGSVDITSGKFVFTCTEAYKIENGKVGAPVKGATLIGNGPDALTRISMIGNDMALDTGTGTCGKSGQWVPVGVGQPTLRIDAMTVGGTAA
ncbi:MAG: metalloprotease TldD [Hyphomicrobiales bacterium]